MIDIEKLVAATKRAAELARENGFVINIYYDPDGTLNDVTFSAYDSDAHASAGHARSKNLTIEAVEVACYECVMMEREYYAKKREAEDTANELDYLRSRNKQLEEEIKMLQGR